MAPVCTASMASRRRVRSFSRLVDVRGELRTHGLVALARLLARADVVGRVVQILRVVPPFRPERHVPNQRRGSNALRGTDMGLLPDGEILLGIGAVLGKFRGK